MTITIKNPQNSFTQKQCFLLDSFIKVIHTPFWNKNTYPPLKTTATAVFAPWWDIAGYLLLPIWAQLWITLAVALLATATAVFSLKVQSPLPPSPRVRWLAEACERLCALWYCPSGGTGTPEELFSKYHLDVQLQSGPTCLLSHFAHTGNECQHGSRAVKADPQPHIQPWQPERGKSSSPKMRLEHLHVRPCIRVITSK